MTDADVRDRLAALTPEKRALLEQRLLAKRGTGPVGALVARDGDGPAPLSMSQQLMWLVHALAPDEHTYNVRGTWRLRGALDADGLERALAAIVARHEAMRTRYDLRDGEPVQIVEPGFVPPLERIDATGRSVDELRDTFLERHERPWDLSLAPPLRLALFRLAGDDHVLHLSCHHIMWDGWSKGVFFKELEEFYDAFCTGRPATVEPLAVQYADFAVWQREQLLQTGALDLQLAHWRKALAGAPPLLDLPLDRPRPAVHRHRGAREIHWFTSAENNALKALCRRTGVTFFVLVTALWATVLKRYSGQEDIVLGTPMAGRAQVELERLIGYFANTVALRVDVSGDPEFTELLTRCRDMAVDAFANQDVSFEQLVRELSPARDLSYSPIFQSLVVLQNASPRRQHLRGLEVEPVSLVNDTSKFDLSIGASDYGERGLFTSFDYNVDILDAATVRRIRDHFVRAVELVLADPAVRVSGLTSPDAAERLELAALGHGPAIKVPEITLHELFRDHAAVHSGQLAVEDGERRLTYAELDACTDALAITLRERGVTTGDRVGLCLAGSAQYVVALLGVLKAGAAAVPLDPGYPAGRLAHMVHDAGIDVVLMADPAEAGWAADLGVGLQEVDLGALMSGGSPAPGAAGPAARADDLAVVVFTSGSTGRPKGVALEHRGLVNHALGMVDLAGFDPADRVLQFASVSFDISLEEIFCALFSGSTLVIRPEDLPLGGPGLREWLSLNRITVLDLPTAFWHEWVRDLDASGVAPPAGLRLVIVGGEQASAELYQTWRGLAPEVRWINTYGPTETSVVATAFEPPKAWLPDPGREMPIGTPLPNVSVHVLDGAGEPVPLSVRGELHIGGVGVARGYLARPEETGQRFGAAPRDPSSRTYRTGDLVRRRAGGELEFAGRVDEQLKIRGFRLEPAEIEHALVADERVRGAIALLREDERREPMLVAYVLVDEPAALEEGLGLELRRALADRLPAFAVPATVTVLSQFPITPNGKVDRAALPAPKLSADKVARRPPSTATERVICETWSELLGTEVGVDDGFFELGGHSLLAVRMFSMLERRLGKRLPLATLMQAPTVGELAQALDNEATARRWEIVVPLKATGSRPPLYLIHDLHGDLLLYRDLVAAMPEDQPVWGIQAQGMDGVSAPLTSISDMARAYLAAIESRHPGGPYLIGGYCFGGNVAYEIAHLLGAAGDGPALLALIDTAPYDARHRATLGRLVRKHLGQLRTAGLRERAAILSETWDNVGYRFNRSARRLMARRLYRDGSRRPAAVHDVPWINRGAASVHTTPVYDGRVTLIQPLTDGDTQLAQARAQRWSAYAPDVEVRAISTAGITHRAILQPGHVERLAAVLDEAVAEVIA